MRAKAIHVLLGKVIISCVLVASLQSQAIAGVPTYHNYDTGWNHNQYVTYMATGANTSYGLWQQAFDFTPADTETFHSLVLTITLGCGYDYVDNTADVYLMADSDGLPGTVLDTWHFEDTLPVYSTPHPRPVLACYGDGQVTLTAGQRYWISLGTDGGNSVISWFQNTTGYSSKWCRNEGAGWNVISSNITSPVFRVNLVPEPMTLSLLAIGGLALIRRQRRG